jgi:hypothetical protein
MEVDQIINYLRLHLAHDITFYPNINRIDLYTLNQCFYSPHAKNFINNMEGVYVTIYIGYYGESKFVVAIVDNPGYDKIVKDFRINEYEARKIIHCLLKHRIPYEID